MICIPHNPILLVTPKGVADKTEQAHDQGEWLEIRTRNVGEVMREVLVRKPGAVIVDAIQAQPRGEAFNFALRVIQTVHRRSSGLLIVALGAADEPGIESMTRQAGATVYLPTHAHRARDTLKRFIDAASVRDGPARVHGPPASGVPPR